MKIKRLVYVTAAVACLAIGAMAGIASSSAAPTRHKAHSSSSGTSERPAGPGAGGPGAGGPPPIHSVSVVPNKEGTGFDTVTMDSGTVQTVSGQELTIAEGTKSTTYKTVTLTIPANATVQLDGKSAQLSELKAEDHVTVCSDSNGTTTVMAGDSSAKPAGGQGGQGGSGGPGGPPPGQGQGSQGGSGS